MKSAAPPRRWPGGPVHIQVSKRRSERLVADIDRHGIVAAVPTALKTEVTELPESRVRVEVEVPAGEVEQRLQRKARELGRSLKLPGFRRGKVPAPLVIQRVGRDAVLEEAVRDTLASWYADAVQTAGIVPVGDPHVDLGDLPPQGKALEFSIEIGVLPTATLGEYKGLEVPRREPEVDEARIDAEIEALRQRLARLETAERAAAAGDFLVVDYEPTAGEDGQEPDASLTEVLTGRDQLIELGAGNLLPGFEEELTGASAGDERTVRVSFPEDYGQKQLAGSQASLLLTVKEVKAKELPEVDDDLAIDVGFDDLAELRQDIHGKLEEAERRRCEVDFREAALDAAVSQAQVQTPDALVQARAREMWERMLHSLAHRGISREAYMQIDGRSEEEILAELRPEAEQALRREAVITAVVAAERIEPDDAQLEEAVSSASQERGEPPAKLLKELRKSGRLEELREDLAARAAIDVIAEHAEPIAPERAEAREKLWTPESESAAANKAGEKPSAKGEQGEAGGLWTPDR